MQNYDLIFFPEYIIIKQGVPNVDFYFDIYHQYHYLWIDHQLDFIFFCESKQSFTIQLPQILKPTIQTIIRPY